MENPKLDPQWRNLLRERSSSAIIMVLERMVERYGATITHVSGMEDTRGSEHFWSISWRVNRWAPAARGAVRPIETYLAVIRFSPDRDMNPMSEFYRRAEKRLKLFAELCRD